MRSILVGATAAIITVAFLAPPADAQINVRRARERAEQQARERAERRADQGVDRAVEAAENAVVCAVTDAECMQKAKADGKEVTVTDASGREMSKSDSDAAVARATGSGGAAGPAGAPGRGVWVNYDFVPGSRVLFADDFTRETVGNFPRSLEFKMGNMEVAEWQGSRWLRATNFSDFHINLPEELPERYTIEFDYAGASGWTMYLYFGDDSPNHVSISPQQGGIGGRLSGVSAPATDYAGKVVPVRILVDGAYAKIYMGEKRVGNAPNAAFARARQLRVRLPASESRPAFFGNLRIAASEKRLYEALSETGRVATQGIYFDVNSDRLRPESTPTLKEIGEMLRDHPELRLMIEGHTDNTGSADANLSLSERRAEAVRQHLLSEYAIDGGRLQSKGMGQTKPAAPNDTPVGRQANRRVELVRL